MIKKNTAKDNHFTQNNEQKNDFSHHVVSLLDDTSVHSQEEASEDILEKELLEDLIVSDNSFELILCATTSTTTNDALQTYIKTISLFPKMPAEQLADLITRAKDHEDKTAALLIIKHHLRLVVWIAMSFQKKWNQNLQDIIQEGNLGLLRALDKFDPKKGIKFSYYATFWIKAYILKTLMNNWRLVKIGTTQAQRKLFYTLNKERQRLISLGFEADVSLLAQHFDVTEEDIIEMQQRIEYNDISLDLTYNEDSSAPILQISAEICVEETVAKEEIQTTLLHHISDLYPSLSIKEQIILTQRILSDNPSTLKTLGDELKISRERVRQIEARLLEKIKHYLNKKVKEISKDWLI
ncbi:MAG: sigma-70 family RNA polymerase sigma factor [Desulfovibrionaceae bacterium]